MKIPLVYDTVKAAAAIFVILVLWVGVGYFAYLYGTWQAGPGEIAPPDTVYVDRFLAPKDTSESSVPTTVVIFKPDTTATQPVCLEVPSSLVETQPETSVDSRGDSESLIASQPGTLNVEITLRDAEPNFKFKLLPENGVLVKPKVVKITAYDPNESVWTQEYYPVPKSNFKFNLSASVEYYSIGYTFVTTDAIITFKRISLGPGVFADPVNGDVGWRLAFRYSIF